MKSQVEKWLAERREKEPLLEVSICWWVEMDRQRSRRRRLRAVRAVDSIQESAGAGLTDEEIDREIAEVRSKESGHKISMYFSDEMYSEIREDARRHGRTISRTVQTAWLMARETIMRYPGFRRE